MDEKELKQLFAKINVWKRGDERAPHKPLLLLRNNTLTSQNLTTLLVDLEEEVWS